MDALKNAVGMGGNGQQNSGNQQGSAVNQSTEQKQGGGFLGGIGDKFNSAAGGGRESEKNEDYLDKGIDAIQQYGLGQGAQDNESAVEQAKDEQISDFIRGQYKSKSGKEFPVADKETRFG
ncbi:MAG: hypothetical protein M1830_003760 [Pleopsidium flavum]|nr:MAG: hypothetical protein M1830_003760 [Pleopsidium flavum]